MSLEFSDIFMGIVSKNIENKIITYNDEDAPWITQKLKPLLDATQEFTVSGYHLVLEVQNRTNKLIKEAKKSYYESLGEKLSNPLNIFSLHSKYPTRKKTQIFHL